MPNEELAIIEPTEPEADSGRGSMSAETILAAVKNNGVGEEEKRITQPDTDSELVLLAKEGNKKAFEKLMRLHQDKAHRLAMRFVRNETDAEDVVQEAFSNAFCHIRNFNGQSQFSSWLYRIVVNQSLMHLRKRKREPEGLTNNLESEWGALQKDEMPSFNTNPLQELERRELDEQIHSAVDSLRPILRGVLIRRDVEERSTNDTAEIMGLPVSTVKTRLFRARRRLQKTLRKYLEDDNLTV